MHPFARVLVLVVPVITSPVFAQAPSEPFALDIPSIMRGPEVYGREPQRVRWSADGEYTRIYRLFARTIANPGAPRTSSGPARQ